MIYSARTGFGYLRLQRILCWHMIWYIFSYVVTKYLSLSVAIALVVWVELALTRKVQSLLMLCLLQLMLNLTDLKPKLQTLSNA